MSNEGNSKLNSKLKNELIFGFDGSCHLRDSAVLVSNCTPCGGGLPSGATRKIQKLIHFLVLNYEKFYAGKTVKRASR